MTLTERQAFDLEMEFLNADLGRLPSEMPVTTIKRELTRALYERPSASPQDVVSWVVTALDKVVTAWEGQVVAKAQPKVVDGVRTAASIIVSAAERAGLAMPVQPVPASPGAAAAVDPNDQLCCGVAPGTHFHPAAAEDEPPAAGWTPSDGGLTPSMFGGI